MNAKERLRLYLEQRRELGESELVLDSLSVDAVLKMIAAPLKTGTGGVKASDGARSGAGADADSHDSPAERGSTERGSTERGSTERGSTERGSTDSRADATNAAAPDDGPRHPLADQPSPAVVVPERRFTESASTDWRAALGDLDPAAKPAAAKPAAGEQAFPQWLVDLGIPQGLSANPATANSATANSATANSATASAASALATNYNSLRDIADAVAICRACALGAKATNAVPGEGNPNADFLCVGEAPGQTEDETGRPFVGAAGQLLTKILAAIKLSRDDVFICNVLKHRPAGNRNPAPDEVRACTPYLTQQIALVKPKVILALGTFAAQTLLNTTTPLGKLRGQVHQYQGVPLIVTYHPAALLRNESWKRPTWDDVQLARRIFDAAQSASGAS